VPIGVISGDIDAQALLTELGNGHSPFATTVYPDAAGTGTALADRAVRRAGHRPGQRRAAAHLATKDREVAPSGPSARR